MAKNVYANGHGARLFTFSSESLVIPHCPPRACVTDLPAMAVRRTSLSECCAREYSVCEIPDYYWQNVLSLGPPSHACPRSACLIQGDMARRRPQSVVSTCP